MRTVAYTCKQERDEDKVQDEHRLKAKLCENTPKEKTEKNKQVKTKKKTARTYITCTHHVVEDDETARGWPWYWPPTPQFPAGVLPSEGRKSPWVVLHLLPMHRRGWSQQRAGEERRTWVGRRKRYSHDDFMLKRRITCNSGRLTGHKFFFNAWSDTCHFGTTLSDDLPNAGNPDPDCGYYLHDDITLYSPMVEHLRDSKRTVYNRSRYFLNSYSGPPRVSSDRQLCVIWMLTGTSGVYRDLPDSRRCEMMT